MKGRYIMNVYEIDSLAEKLAGNTYPGRGIILGVTPDGTKSVAAYFIMGRSVNSRNRVFVQEPDGIRTEAHDPSLMKDPHLIIYHPVREAGCGLIVTNGDQTDTIRFLHKHAVTGIHAAAHNKVGSNRLGAIGGDAQHNTATGVSISRKHFGKITDLVNVHFDLLLVISLLRFVHEPQDDPRRTAPLP
jgi:hypothetical protein